METFMDVEYLDIHKDLFDEIVEDIKQRNLSRNNMPKLIIGTGLSVIYGIPGMKELAGYLQKEISKSNDRGKSEVAVMLTDLMVGIVEMLLKSGCWRMRSCR